jgi:hypothetical protein
MSSSRKNLSVVGQAGGLQTKKPFNSYLLGSKRIHGDKEECILRGIWEKK